MIFVRDQTDIHAPFTPDYTAFAIPSRKLFCHVTFYQNEIHFTGTISGLILE